MPALVGLTLPDLITAITPARRQDAREAFAALYKHRAAVGAVGESMLGELPRVAQRFDSPDGTRRYLLTLADGRTVESVWMPDAARDTICVSSQVGCAVDCRFCLTAQMGFERNLTAGEIVGQVLTVLRGQDAQIEYRRLNLVLMGMGEPLLNLPNVLAALRLMADSRGMNLSPRRVTVSTAGITPRLWELAESGVRPRLAVSLNASSEEQRRELMPVTRKYPLAELLAACGEYTARTGDAVFFEYVLLGGVNDTDEDARRVVELLRPLAGAKVNLLAWNAGPGMGFAAPGEERVRRFHAIVKAAMPCFVRRPRGRDVYAACGQLARMAGGSLGD